MYGDTEVIRRRVDQLREQGVDVRALADRLVAQAEAVGWSGRAAASMRERVRERAAHLREAAGRHDAAAEAMQRHLAEAERARDTIAERERRAGSLRAEAGARVAAVLAHAAADREAGIVREPDPADQQLLDAELPPPGHRDWLDVELPGL
ncbi:hypothetical protein [Nocardioides sp. OK12]|uniref:hypothetical protein n=1 Tax=Nocardioides sp. OK12 TaxID=2758661 RepID=UPI0021C333A5|nr:hypothetical protein [Nocardioides sp. OK12]